MDRKKLIKTIKKFKKNIEARYDIDKIILFGSRASGKSRKDSDVDLVIISKNFKGKKSYKRAPGLYMEWHMNSDIPLPVDFLCYTPTEFDRLKKKITIVKEAVEKGIEIL